MFSKVMAAVLGILGITAFAKDESGKSVLTKVQEEQLTEKFGEKFVASFVKELSELESDGKTAESFITPELTAEMEKDRKEMKELKDKVATLEKTNDEFKATIEKLEKDPANADGISVDEAKKAVKKFAPDMNLKHNKYFADYFAGKNVASYTTDETISTAELKTEFGKYVSSEKMEIIQSLFGQTTSTAYMTTIMTDKTEVRATHAQVTSVLQQFVSQWTPKGTSKFTPLTIKNYKCKINVPIIPSEVMEDVLGYMYDENQTSLENMFVVKYILYQMIMPKLDEEREIALASGRFVALVADANGNYKASDANATMTGYLTQLTDLYNGNDTNVNFLQKGVEITADNVLDTIDKAVQEVKPLYKAQNLFVHADPDIILMYQKAYRAKYPNTKNEDGDKVKIDFTKFTFAPLDGMRTSHCFFITPKENFKHLMSKNPNQVNLRFQEDDYTVKIFAEWWEGTGFYLAEAIFAYISPAYATAHKVTTSNEGA